MTLSPTGMTVLVTADAVGGVWRYALDLAQGLAGRGVKPILAVLGPAPSAEARAEASAIPGLRLIETGLDLDWVAETPQAVDRSGEEIAKLAREMGANLVHLHTPALAARGRFTVPAAATCHSCTATWWRAVRGGALPDDFAWRKEMTGRGLRAVDALMAPSRSFARAIAETYGLVRAPRAVLNGRGMSSARGRHDPAASVFTAGRLWDEGKDVATLDRAARSLSVPVRAAGSTEGPHGESIAFESIEALGSLSETDLAERFAERPVFVSTSLYEPFGLAVLEAAQAGCALVLSDIETFRELWEGAAFFVPTRDDAALAEAVERLTSDLDLRARMGEAARERAKDYGVEAMIDGTLAAYRDALAMQAAA